MSAGTRNAKRFRQQLAAAFLSFFKKPERGFQLNAIASVLTAVGETLAIFMIIFSLTGATATLLFPILSAVSLGITAALIGAAFIADKVYLKQQRASAAESDSSDFDPTQDYLPSVQLLNKIAIGFFFLGAIGSSVGFGLGAASPILLVTLAAAFTIAGAVIWAISSARDNYKLWKSAIKMGLNDPELKKLYKRHVQLAAGLNITAASLASIGGVFYILASLTSVSLLPTPMVVLAGLFMALSAAVWVGAIHYDRRAARDRKKIQETAPEHTCESEFAPDTTHMLDIESLFDPDILGLKIVDDEPEGFFDPDAPEVAEIVAAMSHEPSILTDFNTVTASKRETTPTELDDLKLSSSDSSKSDAPLLKK